MLQQVFSLQPVINQILDLFWVFDELLCTSVPIDSIDHFLQKKSSKYVLCFVWNWLENFNPSSQLMEQAKYSAFEVLQIVVMESKACRQEGDSIYTYMVGTEQIQQ